MITTIDNTQRKFLVQSQGFSTQDIFCNLADIPTVLKQVFEPHDNYKIFEYWNRRFKACSKKYLNEMFADNNIEYRIN
jgi:hypothetical protein